MKVNFILLITERSHFHYCRYLNVCNSYLTYYFLITLTKDCHIKLTRLKINHDQETMITYVSMLYQKLFPEALQKLNLRQAQVRYLPMHLHAKALVLPEWRGDKNVFIKAKVPKYFLKNLATLKIKIPHN